MFSSLLVFLRTPLYHGQIQLIREVPLYTYWCALANTFVVNVFTDFEDAALCLCIDNYHHISASVEDVSYPNTGYLGGGGGGGGGRGRRREGGGGREGSIIPVEQCGEETVS